VPDREQSAGAGDGGSAPDGEGWAEYLGFVIHEARNPLASALWSAQMLERLPADQRAGERGSKLAARVGRAVLRLGTLLEDHFLAERLRAGGLPIHVEPVELVPLLAEQATRAGVAVGIDAGSEASARVAADRALLARALDCILAASGRGVERVEVVVTSRGGELCLRFSGARLSPAALERPGKGAVSDAAGRALALVVAGEVARAHRACLTVDGESLQLVWPRAAA